MATQVEPDRKLPKLPESPQLLKRAEELAKIINSRKELYRDTETWSTHQQLAKLLKIIILTDLDYALDRKVEQLLWNSCFKNYISHLQANSKDKRTKDRANAQVTLSWFLENGSGFYILLLEELRLAFNLSVPFLQSGSPYGNPEPAKEMEEAVLKPSKASCNYICQHCLVHLGDIARYRNHIQQAETFYRHAISMAPSSGQPYNQIAILEASRSNKLSTVYFYVRAVSLSFPFTAAAINLSKLLGKLAGLNEGEHRDFRDRTAKVTQHTFIPLFLRIQGLLHHSSNLVETVRMLRLLTESLTSLVATDSLSTWQLLQMISINMWVWDQVVGAQVTQPEEKVSGSDRKEELSREERLSGGVIADLQAALLSSVLLPVYTLRRGDELLDYYALPAIRVVVEWLVHHPSALLERGFTSRPQIWPGLARLLNEIEILLDGFDGAELLDYPLPEEYDLQAFKPIAGALAQFNYKLVSNGNIAEKEELSLLRCSRIRDLGLKLSREPFNILEKVEGAENAWKCRENQHPEGEDLETLAREGEDLETLARELEEEKGGGESSEGEEDSQTVEWEAGNDGSSNKSILKNKEISAAPGPPRYRGRQNVAMAAILRANHQTQPEQESGEDDKERRVMFRSPSPNKDSANNAATETTLKNNTAKPELKQAKGWKSSGQEAGGPKNVKELDFSRPPPSLHSNFRPPALTSTLFDASKPAAGQMKGIQPIQPQAGAAAMKHAVPAASSAFPTAYNQPTAAYNQPTSRYHQPQSTNNQLGAFPATYVPAAGAQSAVSNHSAAVNYGQPSAVTPTNAAYHHPGPVYIPAKPGPFLSGIGEIIRQSEGRGPEQFPALQNPPNFQSSRLQGGPAPTPNFGSSFHNNSPQYPNVAGLRLGWNENQSPSRPTGAQSSPSTGGGGGGADAPSYSLFSGSPWAGASLLSGADSSPFSGSGGSPGSGGLSGSPSIGGLSGSPSVGGMSGMNLESPSRFPVNPASPGSSLLERLLKQNESDQQK